MKPTLLIFALLLSGCASERIVIVHAEAGGMWGLIRGNAETIDIAREGMDDVNLKIDIHVNSGQPMGVTITTE